MAKKLDTYQVTLDSEVFALSLVTDPAIEVDFIYLSKEEPMRVMLDKGERHMVYGPALIPNKPIYRVDEQGNEFNLVFTKESIEKLAHNYLRDEHTNDVTLQHMEDARGVYVVESWLKESDSDKSSALGFDLPIGTWFVGAKVSDIDTWEKIKGGELKGFSVESLVNIREIYNDMSRIKNNQESIEVTPSFWDELKAIIADALNAPKESADVEEVVDEIEEIVEEPQVEEMESEETVEEAVEQAVEDVVEEITEATDTPSEEADALQSVIDELRAEIEQKDTEIEELRKENKKLGRMPSAKPKNVHASKQSSTPFERVMNVLKQGK